MKKIVLPTDFSDTAWNAMFTALKLYADIPCHFFILNAYEPDFANVMGDKSKQRLGVIYDSMSKYSHQELDKILEYLKENHDNPNHTFEKISIGDDLVSAVKQLMPEKDIDIVIMGTTGATGAKEVFIGSNTVKVIKSVRNRPVLAIPEKHNFQVLNQVLFPTDFSNTYEPFELASLIELTSLWTAKIIIFQVAQEFLLKAEQESNKTLLARRFKDVKHDFRQVEMLGDVAEAITDYVDETDADMVCLIHYKHTFLEKLTREPVVKKVAFHTPVPLLVLPELA